MINDILTRANIRVRTMFEQFQKIVDDNTALIMACVEGGQPELAEPILEMRKTDQQILMEETYKCLVPREELYPTPQPYALDDFQEEDEIEIIPPEDDVGNFYDCE